MAKGARNSTPQDQSDQQPQANVAAASSPPNNRLSAANSVHEGPEGEHQSTFIEIDLFALIKTEIRLICFLDLVHNLFMISTLLYTFVVVIFELGKLLKREGDDHHIDLNGYQLPEICLWGVCLAILLHVLMLASGMRIINQIRRGTYPILLMNVPSHPDMATTSRNYYYVNGILVTFGFMCNICLFIYFPYPQFTVGVVYLFSNCFRAVALAVLRSLLGLLPQSAYDNDMPTRSASRNQEIPTIVTTSPSPDRLAAK